LVLALTATVATACAPAAPAPDPSESVVAAPSSPAPEPSPTQTEAVEVGDPTCETIIPASTVSDFESVGWTVRAEPFFIGAIEVPGGLTCRWADFDGPAGDHLQFYGWSEISDADAIEAQDALLSEGWIREESADGVYITENPETTIAVDDQGYGMTYLFTEGAVELADTKQGLILVEWPPA
ncbi:hypothetical protein QL996_02545, partial [Planococcus sp. APC 4015]|nr:hypothetical protein [Planococcus sp. APC 4015]